MKDFDSLYFVGAGGIGMAALVRYFLAKGKRVAGYDRVASDLTHALVNEGAEIVYDEDPELIPDYCRDPKRTLVVYTPAVPNDHHGLQWFRANGFEVVKRAQVLGIITRTGTSICIAGTHGKTTTSSMATHILNTAGIGCNAFLGGILRNINSNLMLSDTSPFTVIEADEFDRSFLWLKPHIATISATDADHLDIYGTYENYLEGFAQFTELIDPDGTLIIHTGLAMKPRVKDGVKIYTYSRDEGDFHAANVRKGNGELIFDFVHPWGTINDISLGVPVDINIENAVAAMSACLIATREKNMKDISDDMRQAIGTFQGAERRFQIRLKQDGPNGKVVIDDYAHHPAEIRALITSVRDLYPGRHITIIFQPHTYTRTRDLADQFAEALSLADEVILIPIYPAREDPIPGITSDMLLEKVKCSKKKIYSKENLISSIKMCNFDVLLTVGGGDVYDLSPLITEEVKKQPPFRPC